MTMLEEVTVAVRALLRGESVDAEGRYVRLRDVALDHPPRAVPPVSLGVVGPKGLELSGRVADGTVVDWLSAPGYVRHARERIDAGRAAAGRTDAHRMTVFVLTAGDPERVRREIEERRAVGGEQERFMDAPLEHLALLPGSARDTLRVLEEAGADCAVLVSPDPEVPLDAAAWRASSPEPQSAVDSSAPSPPLRPRGQLGPIRRCGLRRVGTERR